MKVRNRILLLSSLLLLVSVGGIGNIVWQLPHVEQMQDLKAVLHCLILLGLFGVGLIFSVLELVRQEIRNPIFHLAVQVARIKEREIDGHRLEFTGSRDIDLLTRALNDLLNGFEKEGNLYRIFAEASPDMIFLLDRDGRVLFGNLNAARQWNYKPEEIIGKRQEELFPPDIAAHHKQAVEKIFETGLPIFIDVHEKIGEHQSWIDARMIPVLNKDGHVTAVLGISRDITERKLVEDMLQNSEERYRTLAESAQDAIFIMNLDGVYQYINIYGAKMLGLKPEALIGKPFENFFPQETVCLQKRIMAEVIKTVKLTNYESSFSFPGGQAWVDVRLAPILDETGKVVSVIGITRDITERKRAEEALHLAHDELEQRVEERTTELHLAYQMAETVNQAKSDFLAKMSHELRTPLGAIIGFSELLEEKHFGDLNPKQEEYVQDILESGQHLLSLINDILDLAKIESGKMELELSSFPIAPLLENSLVMVQEKCMKQGIRLITDIADPVKASLILADERKLKQIMFNLLSNAAKFTPDGGAVTISASVISDLECKQSKIENQKSAILISVSDTSIGIAKEHQAKIFEEFFQVANAANGKPTGTGLGLPLVRHMVEQHGGRVWVESPSTGSTPLTTSPLPPSPADSGKASRAGEEGKGSTFRFTIPCKVCGVSVYAPERGKT